MSHSFGPWSTAMAPAGSAPLDTFWRRRLGLLPHLRSAGEAPRRVRLGVAAVAVILAALPLVRPGAAPTAPVPAAVPPGPGRIYGAYLEFGGGKLPPDHYVQRVVSVAPDGGAWRTEAEMTLAAVRTQPNMVEVDGGAVRVAPDGRSMAFVKEQALWLRDPSGDSRRIAGLPRPWNAACHLVWAPGGRLVVSLTDLKDGRTLPDFETWRYGLDGAAPKRLPVTATDRVEDCSPDGQWLLIVSGRKFKADIDVQLYLMRPDGSDERQLTRANSNRSARFSPGGRSVAYATGDTTGATVWVLPLEGGEPRSVFHKDAISVPELCWSPDGKRLAVTYADRVEVVTANGQKGTTSGASHLVTIDADGGNLRELELPTARNRPAPVGHFLDWR
jgi:Tol biopolymer transport system component